MGHLKRYFRQTGIFSDTACNIFIHLFRCKSKQRNPGQLAAKEKNNWGNTKSFLSDQTLHEYNCTFSATRTAWVLDLSPTVADPCFTASMAYSIWWIRPWTHMKNCVNTLIFCMFFIILWKLRKRKCKAIVPVGSILSHRCRTDCETEDKKKSWFESEKRNIKIIKHNSWTYIIVLHCR